ncbi:hypothetical protein ABZ946_11700 [Streptomyces sp. NPDC046324]|uniref:hypothetical protein n=1 Tax=Streptomyces sp. NPDC046324 TaxID=3154915 RepID=UPI0033D0B0DD
MAGQMECGGFVYDPAVRKVGEYRGEAGPYAMLRPVGGGREWQADPARVRPATAAERLSAGVRAANERAEVEYELSRPPVPVPGCTDCAELAARRTAARARFDWSAETDANVLLRRHRSAHHVPDDPPVTSMSP